MARRPVVGRPGAGRLAGLLLTAGLCLAGARLGLWFVPFAAGLAAGAAPPRWRGPGGWVTVPSAAAGAVAGWAASLWGLALQRLPVGATARAIAALAGLPAYAAVAIAVTLALALLQVLAGAWLGRAVRPGRPSGDPRGPGAQFPGGRPAKPESALSPGDDRLRARRQAD